MNRKKHGSKTSDLGTLAIKALRRAARRARAMARMYGTPVYVWREGKVVSEKA